MTNKTAEFIKDFNWKSNGDTIGFKRGQKAKVKSITDTHAILSGLGSFDQTIPHSYLKIHSESNEMNDESNIELIDELKKSTLTSYNNKAAFDIFDKASDRGIKRGQGKLSPEESAKGFKKIQKRLNGISLASHKLATSEAKIQNKFKHGDNVKFKDVSGDSVWGHINSDEHADEHGNIGYTIKHPNARNLFVYSNHLHKMNPIHEENEMTNQTVNLIDAIALGDTIASARCFGDALMSRVSDLIDYKRQEVAHNMFSDSYVNESTPDESTPDESTNLDEAKWHSNKYDSPDSSSILPASRALHDKTKSSLDDIGGTWDKSKMTVLAVKTNDGKKKFVAGHSHSHYHDVGDSFHAYHDQTGRDLGHHEVENVIHLDNGKVVHHENDVGLNEKRPLSVYK